MLASLDAATPEADIRPAQPEADVFELTDEMAVPDPQPAASSFHKIEPQDDIEFTETAAAKALHRQPAYEPPPFESAASFAGAADIVALDRLRGRIRLQFAGQHRAQQQRPDAGRSGQGNAAADAEILARRQSAGIGRADRQGRNRAGFARALALSGRSRLALIQPSRWALSASAYSPVDLMPCGGFLGARKVPDCFRVGR